MLKHFDVAALILLLVKGAFVRPAGPSGTFKLGKHFSPGRSELLMEQAKVIF